MSVSIFFFGGYPTWTTKHWCSCSKYYIKFIKKIKNKIKTSCCIKKINYFFPSKQKPLSKNICFDMQGTLHTTSCNSWKDPWNVGINILFWGYPTWVTKQWFLCSKYYIKLQFSPKKKKRGRRRKLWVALVPSWRMKEINYIYVMVFFHMQATIDWWN